MTDFYTLVWIWAGIGVLVFFILVFFNIKAPVKSPEPTIFLANPVWSPAAILALPFFVPTLLKNPKGEMLGSDGFQNYIKKYKDKPNNERLKIIIDDILNSGHIQKDDLTIVVIDSKD